MRRSLATVARRVAWARGFALAQAARRARARLAGRARLEALLGALAAAGPGVRALQPPPFPPPAGPGEVRREVRRRYLASPEAAVVHGPLMWAAAAAGLDRGALDRAVARAGMC